MDGKEKKNEKKGTKIEEDKEEGGISSMADAEDIEVMLSPLIILEVYH